LLLMEVSFSEKSLISSPTRYTFIPSVTKTSKAYKTLLNKTFG
jgi:hypothetical protein